MSTRPPGYGWGLGCSFLSAFLWATVYVAVRMLMGGADARVDPVTLSFLRFAQGGVLLFLYCLARRRAELFSLRRRDFARVALMAVFSVVGMSVFLFWGQRHTTAINASMIMSASPVLTMLFGLAAGVRVTGRQVAGMAAATVGCMAVLGVLTPAGWGYAAGSFTGDLLVLAAAACWALGAILARPCLARHHELVVTAWSMLFASAMLFGINVFRWADVVWPADGATWGYVLYLGVFPTALGFYAWNAALAKVPLATVNTMQYLTPLITIALAWLLLGEGLTGFQALGVGLALAGVVAAASKPRADMGISG